MNKLLYSISILSLLSVAGYANEPNTRKLGVSVHNFGHDAIEFALSPVELSVRATKKAVNGITSLGKKAEHFTKKKLKATSNAVEQAVAHTSDAVGKVVAHTSDAVANAVNKTGDVIVGGGKFVGEAMSDTMRGSAEVVKKGSKFLVPVYGQIELLGDTARVISKATSKVADFSDATTDKMEEALHEVEDHHNAFVDGLVNGEQKNNKEKKKQNN